MRLLILLFCLGIGLELSAQEQAKLKLDSYYIDLGQVKIDTSKKWQLDANNTGTALLKLREVDPNCSCVKVTDFPEEILPGKSAAIRGYVKSGSRGEEVKYIYLRSNDRSGDQKVAIRVQFI